MDRDIDREDESEEAPAAGPRFRAKLKVVAHYALLASPVLALFALILAITALILGRAAPPAPDDSRGRIESLNATLLETKNELESLKFTLARERSARAEERKKAEEREAMIIRHVSRLETKQKIAPTLEDQLKSAASAPLPVPAAPAAAPVEEVHAPAPASEPKHADAPVAAEKKTAVAAPAATEKTPAQVKALKEAIDKFNSK